MQIEKKSNKTVNEAIGNLWSYLPDAQVRVITTNGTVRTNGEAVMGKGCAEEAARRFPRLPKLLGEYIEQYGNHIHIFPEAVIGKDFTLVAFPTKEDWHNNSDEHLIVRSACELADTADQFGWHSIVMPRPGCGAGNLNWEHQVHPLLKNLLDHRFHVVTFDTLIRGKNDSW